VNFTQLSPKIRAEMLRTIGVERSGALCRRPRGCALPTSTLPPALSELEASRHLAELASAHLGQGLAVLHRAGAYNTTRPRRSATIMGQPGVLTCYTPYQPEVSQGTLQAMFEYSRWCATCSPWTWPIRRSTTVPRPSRGGAHGPAPHASRAGRVWRQCHPQWRDVVRAYVAARGVDIGPARSASSGRAARAACARTGDEHTACVVVQQPDFFGHVRDLNGLSDAVRETRRTAAHRRGRCTSLGVLKVAGRVGRRHRDRRGQSLGLPLQFGGPWAGLMACNPNTSASCPAASPVRLRSRWSARLSC